VRLITLMTDARGDEVGVEAGHASLNGEGDLKGDGDECANRVQWCELYKERGYWYC